MNDLLANTRMVMINGLMPGVNCHRVHSDEAQGILDIIAYLVDLGHQKFGFINGLEAITSADIKRDAFHRGLDIHGLKGHDYVVDGDFSVGGSIYGMEKFLQLPELPSAILTVNVIWRLSVRLKRHNNTG